MSNPIKAPPKGTTKAPSKLRAGMGDMAAEFIEVWTDADHQRATGLLSILGPDGAADPRQIPAAPPATWLAIFEGMLRVRLLDECLMKMQGQGRVGFYTDARGQEATVVAPVAVLQPGDWIVPSHREGGAALFRGLPLRSYLAQVFGNAHDIGKGRQMPVHPSAPRELCILPMSPSTATQLPQATGIAWAAKIKGDKIVVLAYLGEGATSAEDFHTGVNFAAVFKVPAVFVCVNNGWALSTPASAQSASETFAVKALAYGIPGVRVDGNDVFAVYAAVKEAVDHARAGNGPTLIEAVTYRLGPHSSSDDPQRYRDQADTTRRATQEPLIRLRAWLRANGHLSAADEAALVERLETAIHAAVADEEAVPPPDRRTMIDDVYLHPPASLQEQLADLERIRSKRD